MLFSAVKIIGAFAVLMSIVAYAVLVGAPRVRASFRTASARIASGRFGLLQPAADAIKAFFKEDFTPAHVRKVYFIAGAGHRADSGHPVTWRSSRSARRSATRRW